jgi:hypothetical protein
MPEAHEQVEHAEHIEHAAGTNKKIAPVIAVMALFLAFSEVLGKSAQTEAMNVNIRASDLWNFFQAKTIRRTVVLTAAEAEKAEATAAEEVQAREPIAQQIAQWDMTAARYRSEPETGEGTVELSERAKADIAKENADLFSCEDPIEAIHLLDDFPFTRPVASAGRSAFRSQSWQLANPTQLKGSDLRSTNR